MENRRQAPNMDIPASNRKWLNVKFLAFLLVVVVMFVSSFQWIVSHPLPSGADHAEYISEIYYDKSTYQELGLTGLLRYYLRHSPEKPSAYRMFAAPITLGIIPISTTALDLVSLLVFVATSVLIFFAGYEVAGADAGGFAVILLALSPVILFTVRWFGTEYVTYLGVAGTLFFLLRAYGKGNRRWDWVGLGLSLGLGFLAKASFISVALPMLVTAVILRFLGRGGNLGMLIKASVLGVVIAVPWWVLNYRSALSYAAFSSNYVRHALDTSFLLRFLKWPNVLVEAAFGPLLFVLLALMVVYLIFRLLRKDRLVIPSPQLSAIAVCLAGALPILVLQIVGLNQNMRLIAPGLLPLAVAVGIIGASIQWFDRKLFLAVSAVFVFAQLASFVISPNYSLSLVFPTVYPDQWNWDSLRALADQRGVVSPKIAYMGNGDSFNIVAIQLAWLTRNESGSADWSWQYQLGPIQWDKVMASLSNYDIVVTAPGYQGNPMDKQDLDNANNAEFADKLRQDQRFDAPITLYMGDTSSVPVLVFFKKQTVNIYKLNGRYLLLPWNVIS